MRASLTARWIDWKTMVPEDVRNMLARHAAINQQDKDGFTPLMRAVREKASAEVVRTLLEDGFASVSRRDRHNRTALMHACAHHASMAVLLLLLEGGSPVDAMDKEGWTALLHAIKGRQSLDVIRLLADYGSKLSFSWWNHCFQASDFARTTHASHAVIEYLENRELDHHYRMEHEGMYKSGKAASALQYQAIHPQLLLARPDALLGMGACWATLSPMALRELLLSGADIKVRGDDGNVLMHAIRYQAPFATIKEMLKEGVSVKGVTDKDGNTVLMTACRYHSSIRLLKLLRGYGCSINARNHANETALHEAVKNPSMWKAIPFLLTCQAHINAKDRQFDTPLHLALRGGAPLEVIKTLLSARAEVRFPNRAGWTPMMLALDSHLGPAFVKVLWKARFPLVFPEFLRTRMKKASALRPEKFPETEADVEECASVDEDGLTPLMRLCDRRPRLEEVKQELAMGEGIAVKDHMGMTALHHACSGSADKSVISLLIGSGFSVLEEDVSGHTPLMAALIKGRDKEVVSLLANAGSRLLSKDKAGYVPMGLSLLAGGYDTVRSFLATTLKQLIPALVDPARDWRFFPLEELRDLVRRGASLEAIGLDGRNALHFACIGKAGGKHVRELLKHGMNVNCRDFRNTTPLILAVRHRCHLSVVLTLIAHGAGVNLKDEDGRTALMEAACRDDAAALCVLLDEEASPYACDAQGNTALHHAALRSASWKVVNELLKHGADKRKRNEQQKNAVMLAQEAGASMEILALLEP